MPSDGVNMATEPREGLTDAAGLVAVSLPHAAVHASKPMHAVVTMTFLSIVKLRNPIFILWFGSLTIVVYG